MTIFDFFLDNGEFLVLFKNISKREIHFFPRFDSGFSFSTEFLLTQKRQAVV